jgi:cell wall-associated NlpC family hydrolase
VASASGAASAAEPVTETIELPALTGGLASQTAASADATRQAADAYAAQALQDAAIAKAAKDARKDLAAAKRKAKARQQAAEAAARRAAEARAARSGERRTLSVPVPATGSVGALLGFLRAQLGDAYVMGGTGPNSWDCSGLVQAAYRQVGVDLPRTSQGQSSAGTQVPVSGAQAGDILYWGGAGSAYHVGVYLGNGQYLDAANPDKGVVVQDLSGYPADGAVRVL